MAAKTLAGLVGLVAIHVPGCPEPTIENALHESAADLCRKAKCWREDVSETVDATAFPFEAHPDSGSAVIDKVLAISFDSGKPLDEIDEREASTGYPDWQTATGLPEAFVENPRGTLRLVPLPAASGSMDMTLALAPSAAGTTVPNDVYENYRDTIVSGAVYRLAMIPRQAWTDMAVATLHKSLFDDGVSAAATQFQTHYRSVARRVAAPPL